MANLRVHASKQFICFPYFYTILSKEKKILCVGKLKMDLIAADIYQILEIAHFKYEQMEINSVICIDTMACKVIS